MQDKLEIMVKLGIEVSKLKMTNCKLHRAITTEEIRYMIEKLTDCHLMIIENIDESEQDEMRKLISSFCMQNDENTVIFFLPKNDDITAGIADELNKNIYMSLTELYTVINKQYGINVSTFIDDKKAINASEMSDIVPEDITDVFGNIDNEEFEKNEQDTIEADSEFIMPVEGTKEFELETESVETNDENAIANEAFGEVPEFETTEPINIENNIVEEQSEVIEEQSEINLEAKAEVHEQNKEVVKQSEEIKEQKEVKTEAKEVKTETKIIIKDNSEEINRLKGELAESRSKYNETVEAIRIANTQIEKLTDEVKVLKDKNEYMQKAYDEIFVTDEVLEEPISLAEYDAVKSEFDGHIKEINDLKAKVERLNNDSAKDKEASEKEINNLQKKYDKVKSALNEINASIESGDIHQELIDKYEGEIEKITSERDSLKESLDTVTDNNNELTTRNRELSADLDLEQEYRIAAGDIIAKAFKQVYRNNNKYKETIEDMQDQFNNADGKFDKERKELQNQIKELQNKGNELNDDKKELKKELTDTKNKLKETKDELTNLKIQAGNVTTVIDNNKILESNVRRLTTELEQATNEVNVLRNENEELSVKVKLGGGVGTSIGKDLGNVLSDINYFGNSRIITVFGSGSYGITTFAYSLACKLYPKARVLIIDFDLANPNLDQFVNIIPSCQNIPGFNNNDIRATSLGIVLDRGMDMLRNYSQSIIKRKENTRNGYLDYMSGVYYRISDVKLLSFNYSDFFNYLSNMYDYIIIDMGKFGSGDVKDTLLKKFLNIPNSASVAVTQYNGFKIRNFINSLKEFEMNMMSMTFIINLCNSTSINDRMKRILNNLNYSLIAEEPSIKQNNMNFVTVNNKIIKSQFEGTLRTIV